MLGSLQRRVLSVLGTAGVPWTLTGGGALAGFYLGHRRTDDLDLFVHGKAAFDEEPRLFIACLEAAGLRVDVLIRAPSFVRLAVEAGPERVVVDLVAEPVPVVEPPIDIDGISVDAPHEILVNKLCALVSRSELRDLEDVRALVEAGGDLSRALRDAPAKDGGFSPMLLSWLLTQLPIDRAASLGFEERRLREFRDRLIDSVDAAS